jgi:hypothetical protein
MTEARVIGALALIGVGIVHLQQYASDSYSVIPTIGTLFLLNFVSATAVGIGLLIPMRAAAIRRLLALGGVAIAAGSLAALYLSETGGVFGFSERGYRFAIVLSIVFEVVAVVSLSCLIGQPPRGRLHWPRYSSRVRGER